MWFMSDRASQTLCYAVLVTLSFASGQAGAGRLQKVPSRYLSGTHVVHV